MDEPLKNALWNAFYTDIWQELPREARDYGIGPKAYFLTNFGRVFYRLLVREFFHRPIDEINYNYQFCSNFIKDFMLFKATWSNVYNFIEFISSCTQESDYAFNLARRNFIESCNRELEKHRSGYRVVEGLVTPITNDIEITAIEDALASPYDFANRHIQSALIKLSDRENPDYRNSIKESISAVESICRTLTGKSGFADALAVVEKQIGFHPSFKQALNKLYGYTSDEDGIRHCLLEGDNADFDTAKFMLVACSTFVNYLTAKAAVISD